MSNIVCADRLVWVWFGGYWRAARGHAIEQGPRAGLWRCVVFDGGVVRLAWVVPDLVVPNAKPPTLTTPETPDAVAFHRQHFVAGATDLDTIQPPAPAAPPMSNA